MGQEIVWEVQYKHSVKKDLSHISHDIQYIIRKAIEDKLTRDPLKFGTPLRGSLKGLWKLRVGDYRIVYGLNKREVTILVIAMPIYKK